MALYRDVIEKMRERQKKLFELRQSGLATPKPATPKEPPRVKFPIPIQNTK